MKETIKVPLVILVVLTLGVGIIQVSISGNAVQDVYAEIDGDVMDLCLLLNIYVSGPSEGTVDWDGFLDCVYGLT